MADLATIDHSIALEQFLDLICNDEDLLRAEFAAIIAAEWPSRPPTPQSVAPS